MVTVFKNKRYSRFCKIQKNTFLTQNTTVNQFAEQESRWYDRDLEINLNK